MTMWRPARDGLTRPVYRSLAERVLEAIAAGELTDGDRLPTHRDLAAALGISVQTVSRAYEELARRGAIVSRVGQGTFVCVAPATARIPFQVEREYDSITECALMKPVTDEVHLERMRAVLGRLSEELPESTLFSFRPSRALRHYQQPMARWLSGCGLEADPGTIIQTNGSTAAMSVALMSAAEPGSLVLGERLSHHTLKALTRALGRRLAGVAMDAEGMRPDALSRLCEAQPVGALYLMPSGLGPTTATMSLERRRSIVDIARRHDIPIIENDAWGPLAPGRPAPVAALAPERTYYFTGFSKCLMPGIRHACLVAPPSAVDEVAARHLVTEWMATPLLAEIVARWIEDGTARELLDWQRSALAERNAIAERRLAGVSWRGSPNGLHLWMPLPDPWTEDKFVLQARLRGVAVAPGGAFALSEEVREQGVRVCLGAASADDLSAALDTLGSLVRGPADASLLAH